MAEGQKCYGSTEHTEDTECLELSVYSLKVMGYRLVVSVKVNVKVIV